MTQPVKQEGMPERPIIYSLPGDKNEMMGARHVGYVSAESYDALRTYALNRISELEKEREGLNEPTEEMAYAARGILQFIRAAAGATFFQVREHCERRGDNLSLWPAWAEDASGYVTEEAAALLIYQVMRNSALLASAPKEKEQKPVGHVAGGSEVCGSTEHPASVERA